MRKSVIAFLIIAAIPALVAAQAQAPAPGGTAGVEAFNRALAEATLHMDNAATLALWEQDGVSLLPSTKPILGKEAIGKFFTEVMASLQGARMESFDSRCFDIQVSGDWASEWCTEHQVVTIPDKPKFDGWGKIAFVLHHGSDGKWRIKQEMWNQGVATDGDAH